MILLAVRTFGDLGYRAFGKRSLDLPVLPRIGDWIAVSKDTQVEVNGITILGEFHRDFSTEEAVAIVYFRPEGRVRLDDAKAHGWTVEDDV